MTNISINQLHPFKDHPYKVLDNDEMNNLIESVQEHGIMSPLIVRPLEGTTDQYEIISGHRRFRAAQKAGLSEVPAFIRPVSRDEAAIMLVDSNLHREHILPSEKAFAYKMKAEALKHQGRRTDLTSGQIVPKFDKNRATAVIGVESGESYKTVQRYIRLTYLIPELLDLMDEGKIAFSVGVELSYLPSEIQQELYEIIDREDCTPSYSQAFRLHKSFNNCSLTREGLAAVMSEEKPNQKEKVSFKYDDLRKYFPDSYSVGDIQRYILNLVAKDYQRQHNRSRGGDAR
ncbi:ParB/RepB/Spo0J family partition protein [uncultured Ruminococcus sp.]|uniref:ParB/RepB/Spo0J family partition protein n=1 Tax=uncultured Ruminococcus sp. TaxID=165186 RepID=UPI00292F9600|nr:ParB/RepB/Spo0J family partition protein [uncultured Ruminococcus sp.]